MATSKINPQSPVVETIPITAEDSSGYASASIVKCYKSGNVVTVFISGSVKATAADWKTLFGGFPHPKENINFIYRLDSNTGTLPLMLTTTGYLAKGSSVATPAGWITAAVTYLV